MESIDVIVALIGIVVAIFSIPKSLHAIGEHKRKKFKDELDNFIEYFEKFYKADESKYPKLLRDKAAQNITRSKDMNAELLHYLINLHEKGLVNFDQATDHYYWGSRFLTYNSNNNVITFKTKRYTSSTVSKLNYVLYACFLTLAIFTLVGWIEFLKVTWFDNIISIALIILATRFLNTADDMKEALNFLKLMKNSGDKDESKEMNETDSSIDLAS